MNKLHIDRLRDCLQTFDFKRLFTEELRWSRVQGAKPHAVTLQGQSWQAMPLAELSGVMVFCVTGLPERADDLKSSRWCLWRAENNVLCL